MALSIDAVNVAKLNVQGQIASLYDRDLASIYFKKMKDRDTCNWVRDFYYDMGAMTYFTQREVERPEVRDRALSIIAGLEDFGGAEANARTAVAVSVDASFFRIYGAQIIHYAQQLPSLDFVFVLCGTSSASSQLIEDAKSFSASLGEFNQSGEVRNVSYLRFSVPHGTANVVAFYAAARFFAARRLLSRYENIYLMDVDLQFTEDPTGFLRGLRSRVFAAPVSEGHNVLSPWRRFMAGNIPMNREVIDSGILSDIENYLALGLYESDSWMLDQNALAYAIERNYADRVPALGRRPTWQPPFRTSWEALYKKKQRR